MSINRRILRNYIKNNEIIINVLLNIQLIILQSLLLLNYIMLNNNKPISTINFLFLNLEFNQQHDNDLKKKF